MPTNETMKREKVSLRRFKGKINKQNTFYEITDFDTADSMTLTEKQAKALRMMLEVMVPK